MNHRIANGIDAIAATFAGLAALLMTSAAMAIDIPASTSASGPSGPGIVFSANTVDRGESVTRFYCNEHIGSCTISFECATFDGQMHYEGSFAPVAARSAREVETAEIMEALSWEGGTGGLRCRVLSEQDSTVQQLRRHADGRLDVTSGSVYSESAAIFDISGVEIGRYQSALIHSILSPNEATQSRWAELSIFCQAPEGEDCGCSSADPTCEAKDQVRLRCSEDDGTVHDALIGRIPRHASLYLSQQTIADLIDHRWEGRGLSCEFRSNHRISVEINDIIDRRTFADQSAYMGEMPVDDPPPPLPIRAYAYAIPSSESRDQAELLMYCHDDHHHCPAWLECSTQSGEVLGDRMSSVAGDSLRRADIEIPPRGMRRMSASEIEETITDGSWAGKGRLTCAIRSDKDIRAQVWMHSGDNPQLNNSWYIRSEEAQNSSGVYQVARLHSIPSPSTPDLSNIRIHCTAAAGDRCSRLIVSCSEDDGTVHEGRLDSIGAGSIRHIKTDELDWILGHRWKGIGLACEVRSDRPFNLQLLTRTGDDRLLLNGSAAVRAEKPSM
ncbi:MAG: hypothetical protein ISN28_14475 [Ectothiorhodospiraceae bacterium AqS1]|nr:hypothetical protein [Ectothiorhodospiraceae bacterium AqS1]